MSDPFVAEMKAVILSICPEVTIVDITHDVGKFNIRTAAFHLASAAPYFPEGTVHVAVVDPGVGSERRPILVEAKRAFYLGPDNGLLIPAARREGIHHIYELTNRSLFRESVSATFHGRDIFAPTAAHVACGTAPRDCGPEISKFVNPAYAEPTIGNQSCKCEAFHIDGFGNIITNLTNEHLTKLGLQIGGKIPLKIGKKRLEAHFVRTFADLKGKDFGVLIGSHGYLEVVCREASAAKRLNVQAGNVIELRGA